MHKKYGTITEFSINHPITFSVFKNMQNNWIAEKQYLRKLHETLIVLVNV